MISIIIPVREMNDYLAECIDNILKQTYKNFEIIVVSDKKISEKFEKTKIITAKLNPADKRDLAVKKAKGKIIAFIDDDAYPDEKWLENALKNFKDKSIVGVGGPGLTPERDSFMQQVGGKILESRLASGTEDYRCKIKERKAVKDYPTFNLFIRKKIFNKAGGFCYKYARGEDTKLCLEILKFGKIVYDPSVVVYHHKRSLFLQHLNQVWKCALYRGFFARKFPETSRKIAYFIPSLFVLGLIFGFILSIFNFYLKIIYIEVLIIYLALLIIEAARTKSFKHGIVLIIGMFLTHIVYGVGFLKGILSGELK